MRISIDRTHLGMLAGDYYLLYGVVPDLNLTICLP